MKVGIVASEFFDPVVGQMGGFGWVAKAVADAFVAEIDAGIEPVFVSGLHDDTGTREVHGLPFVGYRGSRLDYLRELRSHKIEALVTIDYRPAYNRVFKALPRTPLVMWVQDPRTRYDDERIATLTIPGRPDGERPQGVRAIDCTGLREVLRRSRMLRRPVRIAGHAHYLREKIEGTYGLLPSEVPEYRFLPDPLVPTSGPIEKTSTPSVVFLGRIDPIKRPWIFTELARLFPTVEFHVLGKAHFTGLGSWAPVDVAENVIFHGHVDGDKKRELLGGAWAVINTSVHEALPISLLEALLHETPILSCQNPDEIAARFGYFVGRWEGDGLDAVPYFADSLRRLLDDDHLRSSRARDGRKWVEETHTQRAFLDGFISLCREMGVGGDAGVAR